MQLSQDDDYGGPEYWKPFDGGSYPNATIDPNEPTEPTPIPGDISLADQIRQWYQAYLGRDASNEEVASHLQNPGGGAGALNEIRWSPEAEAYAKTKGPQRGPTGEPGPPNIVSGPGGGGADTTLGSLLAPFTDTFTAPASSQWSPTDAPSFRASRYPGMAPFSFDKNFTATSADDVLGDPSYGFRLKEGVQALENSAAGRGTLRSGGTLKDFLKYGQQFASNEYANIDDRRFRAHQNEFGEAAKTWENNYRSGLDAYDRLFGAEQAEFAPRMESWRTGQQAGQRQSENDYTRSMNEFLLNYDIFRNNQNDPFNKLFAQQQLGFQAAGA